MKPWEEEWCSDAERIELVQYEKPYGPVAVGAVGAMYHRGEECLEGERARLAAAAPAMARLLLELEWASTQHDEGGRTPDFCPSCDRFRYDGKDSHAPDCAWLAVMRAAGVRE